MTILITDRAEGAPIPGNSGLRKIAVTLRTPIFRDVKAMAIASNRSISAEIRHIVEAAVRASKKLEER